MQNHSLQQQRFELKYLIPEEITGNMRDFISCYLDLDDYGVGRPNMVYPVHSLYLDSAGLETHHAGVNGTKNRFKIRLRYYDDKPNTPVFFEVKGRVDNCILKQRCGLRRDAVALALAGQWPEMDQLFTKSPRHLSALQRFNYLMLKINARPKLHNNYLREAWVSRYDNSIRVTFDRNIRVEPFFRSEAVVAMKHPLRIFPEFVVLELKFTTRFPDWFKALVRKFNLMQAASAKYSNGVEMLGEHRFHDGDRSTCWEAGTLFETTTADLHPDLVTAMED